MPFPFASKSTLSIKGVNSTEYLIVSDFGTQIQIEDVLMYELNIKHTNISITHSFSPSKHTHTFSSSRTSQNYSLWVIVIIFEWSINLQILLNLELFYLFFLFFPNCEPFHIASLLQSQHAS